MNKIKQKQISWVKMPVNLMDNEFIAELIAQKGMAGFGVYLYLILMMYRRACRCLTMTQIRAIKVVGATQKTILSVVNDFGLFNVDKFNHVYSTIDFLGFNDEENDDSDSYPNVIGFESDCLPSPTREYIKDKDEDKDHHIDGDAGNPIKPNGTDFISQIPKNSQWTETALMKSGFAPLIMRNWEKALELFRQHTIVNLTAEKILSLDDAKKYFYYYISNGVSGAMLRKHLEEYEKNHTANSIYGYEDADSAPGHRSYHGIPLPDDAPPRPDGRAEWDFENNCWNKI